MKRYKVLFTDSNLQFVVIEAEGFKITTSGALVFYEAGGVFKAFNQEVWRVITVV